MSNVLLATLPPSFPDVVGRQVADDYLHDESKLQIGRPTELYLPETTAQLQAVVRHCYENNRPVRVSGVRTGLTGVAVPEDGEVLISLERLKETVLLEETSVTVSAGITLAELQHFLDERSATHFFPVNPTERGASIGGVVSTNAGGSRSFH